MKTRLLYSVLALLALPATPHTDAQDSLAARQSPVLPQSVPKSAPRQTNSAPVLAVHVVDFKKLTSTAGWVSTGNRILMTTDDGAHWKDVSPPLPGEREDLRTEGDKDYADVFFLSAVTGWVLFQAAEGEAYDFILSYTFDGGATWSATRIKIPHTGPVSGGPLLGGGANLSFADADHGWLLASHQSGSAFSFASLIATSDGGRTWQLPDGNPGFYGDIRIDPNGDIWVCGGPNGGDSLAVSRDGANSFQNVALPAPPEIAPAKYPTYSLPFFEGGLVGYETVGYSGGNEDPSAEVLFATSDGGRTWIPGRILSNLPSRSIGGMGISTVADGVWMRPDSHPGQRPTLEKLSSTRGTTNGASSESNELNCSLSFFGANDGWMNCSSGLLSTTNGGAAWKDITPRARNGVLTTDPVTPGVHVPVQLGAAPGSAAAKVRPMPESLPAGGIPNEISQRLGFDRDAALSWPTMQTWWTFSPYYDVGVYLPRSHTGTPNPNLTKDWVTEVSNGQGWGIIPIWSGLQPPCTVEHHVYLFSSDPTIAEQQGIAEAATAYASAVSLGLDGTIIYLDLEEYDHSKCGNAVRRYINGWIEGLVDLNPASTLGIYGGRDNAEADFPQGPGTNVWISGRDQRVTVWGIGAGTKTALSDSLWPDKQRIHQYAEDRFELWHLGPSYKVDSDIVDAPVAISSNQVFKPIGPTTLNPVAPSGTDATELFGIDNGVNNGSGFTPGTAAGISFLQYDANNPYQEGDPVAEGFTWSSGTAAVLPALQGSTFGTQPYAINNLGIAVGNWNYPDGSRFPGFVYDAKSNKFLTQDIDSGAYFTILSGINDAGWIVGEVVPSEGDAASCALFKPGSSSGTWTPTLFSPPDGSGCGTVGINGIGLVVGYSANDTPFAYDLEAGDPQNAAPLSVLSGYSGIYPWSINNNGVITGEVGGTGGFILNDGEYLTLSGEVTLGVNDDLEFVGTANEQGFILETPH